jgi:hypothetical protein
MIIIIPSPIVQSNINRLTNQIWKLIPMRENEENWLNHLDTLVIELAGLKELSSNVDEHFLILLSKLKGLRAEDTTF